MAPKRVWFAVAAMALSLLIGLAILELALGERQRRIASSNEFDPGLFVPDPTLGWRAAAHWQGRHKHWDFDVRYDTGADGFRVSPEPAKPPGTPVCALLGDSFTFGLGVADGETFAALLDRNPKLDVENWGMPGYSTDQEYLLLKERLERVRPASVILVLYVANDFFDNLRGVPMQVSQPKPVFSWKGTNLELALPDRTRHPAIAENFADYILGPGVPRAHSALPFRTVWSALGWLRDPLDNAPFTGAEFLERNRPALRLACALMQRMRALCDSSGTAFSVAILTGRSYFAEPGTVSARFQEALREATVSFGREHGIATIDLAAALQASPDAPRLFFPNDGHLTPEGHRAVAEVLARQPPFAATPPR